MVATTRSREQPPAAFTTVAREQLPWLYSLARRLVGEGAEDAVQECLVKAYRGFEGLRDQQAAPAWFRQILLNCIRERARQEAGLPCEEPVDPLPDSSLYRTISGVDAWPYSDSAHIDFLASLEETEVWRVLDRVKPLYRAPLVLVHREGLSTRQVARLFGVSQGTVLSWLHRGRKYFERELWDYAWSVVAARNEGTSPDCRPAVRAARRTNRRGGHAVLLVSSCAVPVAQDATAPPKTADAQIRLHVRRDAIPRQRRASSLVQRITQGGDRAVARVARRKPARSISASHPLRHSTQPDKRSRDETNLRSAHDHRPGRWDAHPGQRPPWSNDRDRRRRGPGPQR